MKSIKRIIFLFVFFLCATFHCEAQTGWTWERVPSNTNTRGATEGGASSVDQFGNVYMVYYAITHTGIDTVSLEGSSIIDTAEIAKYVVMKLDTSGNVVWQKSISHGGALTLNDYSSFTTLPIDSLGNIYILGNFWSATSIPIDSIYFDTILLTSSNNSDFLAKLDSNGNFLWAKHLDSHYQSVTDMQIDKNGYLYITGNFMTPYYTIDTITFTNTGLLYGDTTRNFFLSKFSPDGNVIWAKNFGGNYFSTSDLEEAMTVSPSGNIYLLGTFDSALTIDTMTVYGGYWSGFIAKISTDGRVLRFDTMSRIDIFNMKLDDSENIYLTGSFSGSPVSFGIYYFLPLLTSNFFLGKMDSNFNPIWARTASGMAEVLGVNLSIDSCHNVWVTGVMGSPGFYGNLVLDGYTIPALPEISADPSFIAEFNSSGIALTGMALQSGGEDEIGIITDNKGNIYFSADFQGPYICFGTDTFNLPVSSTYPVENIFMSKYRYATSLCHPVEVSQLKPNNFSVVIYPNPAYDLLKIATDVPFDAGSELIIFDIAGRPVQTNMLVDTNSEINIAGLEPGFYTCIVFNGQSKVAVSKLVKE